LLHPDFLDYYLNDHRDYDVSRLSQRQLELALYGRHAVRSGLRMAARTDEKLEPVGPSLTSNTGKIREAVSIN
jgi:hypothetical protein